MWIRISKQITKGKQPQRMNKRSICVGFFGRRNMQNTTQAQKTASPIALNLQVSPPSSVRAESTVMMAEKIKAIFKGGQ